MLEETCSLRKAQGKIRDSRGCTRILNFIRNRSSPAYSDIKTKLADSSSCQSPLFTRTSA